MYLYLRMRREYESWSRMRRRCLYPGDSDYRNYGARGIAICDRWSSFAAFIEDMGRRPIGTTIDRIDNDGNYEPGNCRWADGTEQRRRTRRIRLNTEAAKVIRFYRGRISARQLATIYNVNATTIRTVWKGGTWN